MRKKNFYSHSETTENNSKEQTIQFTIREIQAPELFKIPENAELAREDVYRMLCLQRGKKFHRSRMSVWCAELGIPDRKMYFDAKEFLLLQRMNIAIANREGVRNTVHQLIKEGLLKVDF